MGRRKQIPKIQLNLNIPEDFHAVFEAARRSAGIQFKQEALCEAMLIWSELGPYLNQFRHLPESDALSEQKFAKEFVEWFAIKNNSCLSYGDKGTLNELQPYIVPLQKLTIMLNRIIEDMAANQGSREIIGRETRITRQTSSQPNDGAQPGSTANDEDVHIGEIRDALESSAGNRDSIERDRRRMEETLEHIEHESNRDRRATQRTA